MAFCFMMKLETSLSCRGPIPESDQDNFGSTDMTVQRHTDVMFFSDTATRGMDLAEGVMKRNAPTCSMYPLRQLLGCLRSSSLRWCADMIRSNSSLVEYHGWRQFARLAQN